jgi:sulfopyruvate decarboxylase TPP-binding subunit
MATYQVQINEQIPLGKSIVALLQSANEAVVSFVKKKEKRELTYEEVVNKSDFHRQLDRAFKDVRLMLDGKKREKTLDELIHELQNSND